jgi:hypothetical protein
MNGVKLDPQKFPFQCFLSKISLTTKNPNLQKNLLDPQIAHNFRPTNRKVGMTKQTNLGDYGRPHLTFAPLNRRRLDFKGVGGSRVPRFVRFLGEKRASKNKRF